MKRIEVDLIVLLAMGFLAGAAAAQTAENEELQARGDSTVTWHPPMASQEPEARPKALTGDAYTPPTERPPLAKTEAEQNVYDVLDDLDRNYRQRMNISVGDGRLLRVLTESIGAKHVVELGTFNGYSALWIGLALRSTGGKLTTYEINEEWAAEARENFKRAGLDDLVTIVIGDAHREVKELKEPIDLLFLDADKDGYVFYLKRLLPLVRPGGLIVGHNMARPKPDPRYLEAITTNPDLETVFLLMDGAGVGVTLKKR
jgi:predicted O-methyltransferase YrrM